MLLIVEKDFSTVDAEMANIVTEKERREYIKKVEKDVFAHW